MTKPFKSQVPSDSGYIPSSQSLLPDEITTINYTLSWPHLEHPSNTTFAGPTQIDICKCPRSDWSDQSDNDWGHIYTRYICSGPDVHFPTSKEESWVLDLPHGPVNMLRPATQTEYQRRLELLDDENPGVFSNRNFLLLTGPCPRGRYQAYATLCYLKSLSLTARQHVSCFSLMVQPYEEDCIEQASKQAFAELADYIIQHLPNFTALHLYIWDDEMKVQGTASEFGILLRNKDITIHVGWNWMKGRFKNYTDEEVFRDALTTTHVTRSRPVLEQDVLEADIIWTQHDDGLKQPVHHEDLARGTPLIDQKSDHGDGIDLTERFTSPSLVDDEIEDE